MVRIALEAHPSRGEIIHLTADDWHYVSHVMRRHIADEIEVLTAQGEVWTAVLDAPGILRWANLKGEALLPRREITLCQAMLKGDHFADVVERATEAGVRHFIPVITERTIVREVSVKKLERWRHIAREASEQSHQPHVPDIAAPQPLSHLKISPNGVGYALDPQGTDEKYWLSLEASPLMLVAGPEGGLTRVEYLGLYDAGFRAVSLGPRIYRAENAGAFAAILFLQ